MKSKQSAIAKLTKNMMVVDLMKQTGWSRARTLKAIEELEAAKLIQFQCQGGMILRVNAEVY
ncbi:hypothetical protein HKO46_02745 [Streptococcus equi subsp. zooepidemicus]|uniref:hypothetical protein n=1 Tax=Streptococcus equi TaxID=1336 RepID=UPI0002175C6B|nr:hypothetical protein [Streptococcus equi]AEJ26080.1 conserved hypothetical protein [Streptococcus equi subsp. zooepidemicus ATCC 35246]AIA68496.1 hypothetical protein Q426_00095 [Streptococcus equi subsp. zooepidemicus CY]MBR7683804.1 hypothetical protein [Streptococcus equi subsp. zooepidemicus]MBR7752691.1 hypothetical protein [Streptococcus equi subsp. zooepidemicus]MBR7775721.1 hypothetical protein [Streptococcus equi subsp. zooepidemicus]